MSKYEIEKAKLLQHLQGASLGVGNHEETKTTPLLSLEVKYAVDHPDGTEPATTASTFTQCSLLGFNIGESTTIADHEPILVNTRAPNSIFICGSQHSGKSYTLSCLLEACIVHNLELGSLPHPMHGVLFHYDVDAADSLAEAASLCAAGIKVNILVSRSNFHQLSASYMALPGAQKHLTVRRLLLRDQHLNVSRMQRLMALTDIDKGIPLYMEIVQQVLRDMAIAGMKFNFRAFEAKVQDAGLDAAQQRMLKMRLMLLGSFMETQVPAHERSPKVDLFKPVPGTLTIIDLSDPLIDSAFACTLFDICLGLFKQHRGRDGMVVALDEAHKYLGSSTASANLSDSLLTTIREQRHNATRVIIATQEPTVSEKLLDLSSVSIVHRFTSPAWFETIKDHLGGASRLIASPDDQKAMLAQIMELNTGESFVFSPTSYVRFVDGQAKKLGTEVLKMKTRLRSTVDSGKSKLAGDSDSGTSGSDTTST